MTGHGNFKPAAQRMGLQGGDGWLWTGIQGGNQSMQAGLPLRPGLAKHGDIRATNQTATPPHQHNGFHLWIRLCRTQMSNQTAGNTGAHGIDGWVFDNDHGNRTVLFQTGQVRHELSFFMINFQAPP